MDQAADNQTHPKPVEVDKIIGARLRTRRILVQMTQEQLGDVIGLSPQQIHKYEKGSRIGAGRLAEIASILDVPIAYFYDTVGLREDMPAGFIELLSEPYVAELLRHYSELSLEAQANIVSLLASIRSRSDADNTASSKAAFQNKQNRTVNQ